MEAAYAAHKQFSAYSQERVDAIVAAMAEAGLRAAEPLARMAVEETGFGKYEDKILKNKFGSQFVYNAIKDLKTVGILREDREKGIVEIAAPVGVIAAIVPSTNPTSTAINKILISLKGCNGIVLSPHPSAANCILETSKILTEAAMAAGAPEGIIQCMTHAHAGSDPRTDEAPQDGADPGDWRARSWYAPPIVRESRPTALARATYPPTLKRQPISRKPCATFSRGSVSTTERCVLLNKRSSPMSRSRTK